MSPHASEALEAAVIFTGRGGSGTRLLSQLADEVGVFIGNAINRSGDSIEWVRLVYRLAVAAGASLQLPSGSRHRGEIRAIAAQVLGASRTPAVPLWGLKLPEAMLVLPLFIDAFPQAKVVHMTRHPIASALRRTHMTSRTSNAVGAATLPNAYRYASRDVGAIASDEPYVHNAFSWNYQVRRVLEYGRGALGPGRYLEMRYEDVCTDSSAGIAGLRAFLGCATGGRAGSVAVDPARMSAWDPADPRVAAIWAICGETAGLLGYALDRDAAVAAPGNGSGKQRQ
jgi:hypothetical protein